MSKTSSKVTIGIRFTHMLHTHTGMCPVIRISVANLLGYLSYTFGPPRLHYNYCLASQKTSNTIRSAPCFPIYIAISEWYGLLHQLPLQLSSSPNKPPSWIPALAPCPIATPYPTTPALMPLLSARTETIYLAEVRQSPPSFSYWILPQIKGRCGRRCMVPQLIGKTSSRLYPI